MKTINVTFEDDEHKKLLEEKGKDSWRQYILDLYEYKVKFMEQNGG